MTELTDKEIEEILKCLDNQGFNYIVSRKEIAKILREFKQ